MKHKTMQWKYNLNKLLLLLPLFYYGRTFHLFVYFRAYEERFECNAQNILWIEIIIVYEMSWMKNQR